MTTTVPQPRDSWEIVSQTPTTDFSTPGQTIDGVRVTFLTGGGVTDSVFVPNNRYGDLDYIRTQIAAKVTQHAQVATLKG